jgi:predicted phosphodiesterase
MADQKNKAGKEEAKLRILSVADKRHKALYDYFEPQRWRDIDLVISCGDLDAGYLSFLVTVINTPLLYVPGNHDYLYEENPPEGCDSIDGKVLDIRGVTVGGLGGSIWYNGGDLQYSEKQMSKKVKKIIRSARKAGDLDIFVSHAPPRGIHDLPDRCHNGFCAFRDLIENLHPKVMLHGHTHEVYNKQDRETVIEGVRVINTFGYYVFEV